MNDNQPKPNGGNWRANVAIVLVSLIIATFAAEGLSRLMFPEWAPRTGRVTRFWQYDDQLGWAHKPGEEGRFESFGFDTFVRINSHGFRGPERSFERIEGRKRVAVIGDSFVWGFGVEEEQIFTQLLDTRLGDDVEIINLGVSGYSTDQELLMYRDVGRKYRSDLVLLVVAANDVALNAQPLAYLIYPKPLFILDGPALRLTNQPVPVKNWILRIGVKIASQSYVLNQLNRTRETWRYRRAGQALPAEAAIVRTWEFPHTIPEKITMRLIEQMRDDVRRDGAEFLVMLVDNIYAGRKFGEALEARSIEYVALDDVMSGERADLHLPDKLHWTATGHELVATAVEGRIREMLGHRDREDGKQPPR